MFDTRLRTLVTLLQVKNYSKTAEMLFITQPAVTNHIKTLEKENNVVLFTNQREFKLSNNGEIIYQYAIKAMQQYQQLRLALKDANDISTKITFCVTNQISFSYIAHILKRFMQLHQQDQINMQVDSIDNIIKKLDEGKIEFAIVDNLFDKICYDNTLLHKSSIVLACSPNHELALKPKVKIEQLKDEKIVLDIISSGIREVIDRVFQMNNIYLSSFSNIIEINDPGIIKNIVMNDKALGFFYLSSISKELKTEELKIIELVDIDLKQEFNFISNINSFSKNKNKKIAEEFITLSREEIYK